MRTSDELKVLAPVIAVVRDELADRDDDAIPIRLRKAAKSTGRTLPPPHQQAIVAQLESDEAFRATVHTRWGGAGNTDALLEAYLTDPADAEQALQAAVAMRASSKAEAGLAAATVRIAELEARLNEAKARLADAKRSAEADRKRQAASDRRSREGLERATAKARSDLAEAEERIATLRRELVDGAAEAESLRGAMQRLADRRSKKATNDPSTRTLSQSQGPLPTDPRELAAFLDSLERRLRYYREPSAKQAERDIERPALALPPGISPESAEAVDAIIDAAPDRFVIDGYNVAGAVLFDAFSSRAGRDAAVARADMLQRSTDATVTVVFDAAEVKGDTTKSTDFGVSVVFEPDSSADDAIVLLARNTGDRCVVVTNDRELQARVARPDCVVVYTTALVRWSEHLNDR
jgi:hypothetical protein